MFNPMPTVQRWLSIRGKGLWWNATFGGEHGTGGPEVKSSTDYVQTVLDEFGSQLIELGRPVWRIQAIALNRKLMNNWH
jgi:hypothetical protein